MSLKLTGRVTSKGAPVPMAVVELHNSSGDVVDQVQVDAAGAFTYHLSPGRWRLQAWDNQGGRASAELTLGGEDAHVELEIGPQA